MGTYSMSIVEFSTTFLGIGSEATLWSYINTADNLIPGRDALVFAAFGNPAPGEISFVVAGFELETFENLNAITSPNLSSLTAPDVSLFEFNNSFILQVRDLRGDQQDIQLRGYLTAVSVVPPATVDETAQSWLLALLGFAGLGLLRARR